MPVDARVEPEADLIKIKMFTVLCIAVMVLNACGNTARYQRGSKNSLLDRLAFGVNAKERKMADGVYQLTVQDSKDKHEIQPIKLMMFFAAELTKEQGYETFVMLPNEEKPFEPREAKRVRGRVLSGEFNEFMKNPKIKVKITTTCRHGACSAVYRSKAIIVMLKGEERRKARSLDARKIYTKLKPTMPEQTSLTRGAGG